MSRYIHTENYQQIKNSIESQDENRIKERKLLNTSKALLIERRCEFWVKMISSNLSKFRGMWILVFACCFYTNPSEFNDSFVVI